MSREIKFRVWCTFHKSYEQDPVRLSLGGHILHHDKYGREQLCSPDTHILMQYTGLKDKNGKEIYEGDIVYIAGTGNCEVKMDCCGYWAFGEDRLDYQDVMEDLEQVIGNIYENPEAL